MRVGNDPIAISHAPCGQGQRLSLGAGTWQTKFEIAETISYLELVGANLRFLDGLGASVLDIENVAASTFRSLEARGL